MLRSVREQTVARLQTHGGGLAWGEVRVAAKEDFGGLMPFPPKGKGGLPFDNVKREIPADHAFNPKAAVPLAKMLWSLSVALGHASTAHREFARLKSVQFSPDGKVGGRGYVMTVKDVRAKLFEACDLLSEICDTVHDEIHAPHWQAKIGELEKKDLKNVELLLGDAEENLEDPEGEADEDFDRLEDQGKPEAGIERYRKHDEGASQVPGGDAAGVPQRATPRPNRQASEHQGNSSLPVTTLPGPRVDHLDRGEQTGPAGSYNRDEGPGQWPVGPREYDYESEWSNNLSGDKCGESAIPDHATDPTPTEAYDFGIGFGEGNDAHGQGINYGPENPSSGAYGVAGPHADLPRDPGGATRDPRGPTGTPMDQRRHDTLNRLAYCLADSTLPNDYEMPVARADYYRGLKDNDFNGTPRGSTTTLPGDNSTLEHTMDRGTPNTGYTLDRRDPQIKWDYSTPNMRPDFVHQRPPVQGPYVKQG